MTESFFFGGGSAYALRGYGVTLGSSSSHDPNLSRDAAFEDFDEDAMVIVFHSRDDCAPLFRAAARIAVASSL